jgi:hypothetical protein
MFFQIDDYILTKSKKVSKGVCRIYRNMRYHLKEFEVFRQKPITFEILDYTFYEDFVNFLTYDYVQIRSKEKVIGLKANSVGKTIKHFRTSEKPNKKKNHSAY